MEVICHDFKTLVRCDICNVSHEGCELRGPVDKTEAAFARRSNVLLSIYDAKTGKTMTCKARLVGFSRKEGRWSYRIRWTECPAILQQTEQVQIA